MELESQGDFYNEITKRALTDDTFAARVFADPKTAIRDDLGIDIPDFISVEVHQHSLDRVHVVLPPTEDLTEEQMEEILAGCSENPMGGSRQGFMGISYDTHSE